MKKLLLLSLIFIFLVSNTIDSQTVYVTKTGKKYHNENCRSLSKSSFAISLPDAIAKGYTACLICKPPSNVKASTSANSQQQVPEKSISNSYQPSNSKNTQSVLKQCSATTKAGTRCKRMTKSSNGLCWQHGGN